MIIEFHELDYSIHSVSYNTFVVKKNRAHQTTLCLRLSGLQGNSLKTCREQKNMFWMQPSATPWPKTVRQGGLSVMKYEQKAGLLILNQPFFSVPGKNVIFQSLAMVVALVTRQGRALKKITTKAGAFAVPGIYVFFSENAFLKIKIQI